MGYLSRILSSRDIQCVEALGLLKPSHGPAKDPVHQNDRQHYANPLALIPILVSILRQYTFPINLALRRKLSLVHALAAAAAVVGAIAELVDHHAAEDVALLLEVSTL